MTVLQLEEIVKLHSPKLIFLFATKNRKDVMNKVRLKLRYDRLFVIYPVGKSGGLAGFSRGKNCRYVKFNLQILLLKCCRNGMFLKPNGG